MQNIRTREVILSFFIGMIIGIGATWLWFEVAGAPQPEEVITDREEDQTPTTPDDSDQTPQNGQGGAQATSSPLGNEVTFTGGSFLVADQAADDEVVIDRVVFDEPMWVVIHELNGDQLGNALGAGWFPEGEHAGVVELLRATVQGRDYAAVPYSDNGNRLFEFRGADQVIENADGVPVRALFRAQ